MDCACGRVLPDGARTILTCKLVLHEKTSEGSIRTMQGSYISRRSFIGIAGMSALAVAGFGLAGCSGSNGGSAESQCAQLIYMLQAYTAQSIYFFIYYAF